MKFVFFRQIRIWILSAKFARLATELKQYGLADDAKKIAELAMLGALCLEMLTANKGEDMLAALDEGDWEHLTEIAQGRHAKRMADAARLK
jgi:hypothetical protein